MRAILGVYDKTGIEAFGKGLAELGWELASTGGTYSAVQKAGIPVRKVEDLTGFPEMLDGLLPLLDSVVCTQASATRSLLAADLADASDAAAARGGRLGMDARVEPDPLTALALARASAGPGGSVLVVGSLYLLEDLRDVLAGEA